MKLNNFSIIAAQDEAGGIGKNGKMPWKCAEEFKYFANKTKTAPLGIQNAVIMGRKTWESLPSPLPDRVNIVVSTTIGKAPGAIVVDSLEKALSLQLPVHTYYVIGGAEIYKQAIKLPQLKNIYLSKIRGTYDCDVFFPEIPNKIDEKGICLSENDSGELIYNDFSAWLYPNFDTVFRSREDEARELVLLPEEWNSYSSPSPDRIALENMLWVLQGLTKRGINSGKLLPMVGGGMLIYFSTIKICATLECHNDASVYMDMHSRLKFSHLVIRNQQDLDSAILRLAKFFYENISRQ